MKGEAVKAWAAKAPWSRTICEWLIRDSERDVRKAVVQWQASPGGSHLTWKQLYRRGWRVVKVRVEEIG